MSIDIVEFDNHFDKTPKARSFATWDDLVAYFSVFRVGPKDDSTPAWSPMTYLPGASRGNRGVDKITVAFFDLDDMTEEELQHTLDNLEGSQFFMHSSPSDKLPGKGRRFRLLLPLERPISKSTWNTLKRELVTRFSLIKVDPKVYENNASILYVPSVPTAQDKGTVFEGKAAILTPNQERLLAIGHNPAKPENKPMAARIALGKPLATEFRNDAMNKSTWIMGAVFPEKTPEELLEIMKPSITAMPRGHLSLEGEFALWLEMFDKRTAKKEQLAEEDKELAGVFSPATDLNSITAPKYTAEEIAGVNPKHWVIQKGSSYFFLKDGDYKGPFCSEEAESAMRQELAKAPLVFSVETNKKTGTRRNLTLKEMIITNGTVAHHLEGSMMLAKSVFDSVSMTFTEAIAPLRDIKPVNHPEVNDWLVLLGGTKADRLLDWVASVTLLQHQCAGLLLEGDAGSGKTLLANGLATLWSKSGPTPFETVASDFNSSIATCPLIFADEGFNVPRNANVNDLLRRVIASPSFHLRRKFVSDTTCAGAVRVLMCTNDDRILKDFQDVNEDARVALGQRILLVGIHDGKASSLLSSMPHADKACWKETMIAEHALYLRDTRTVVPGKRFIVEGTGTEITDRLSVSAGVAPDMISYIVEATANPDNQNKTQSKEPDIVAGGGRLLVSASLFKRKNVRHYEEATGNNRLPSNYLANQTLANLSSGEVKIKGRTFFHIKMHFLAVWNETARSDNYNAVLTEVEK